jgi:hypothetical protein
MDGAAHPTAEDPTTPPVGTDDDGCVAEAMAEPLSALFPADAAYIASPAGRRAAVTAVLMQVVGAATVIFPT